jgi:hypothetical protein
MIPTLLPALERNDRLKRQHGAIRQYFSAERPMPVTRSELSAKLGGVLAALGPDATQLPHDCCPYDREPAEHRRF